MFVQLRQPSLVDDGLFEIRVRGDNQCLHKENLHFYRCMIAHGGMGHKNALFRGVLTSGEVLCFYILNRSLCVPVRGR